MSRYYLRSMEIGFEIPFIDIKNQKGTSELSSAIVDKYLAWFDIIKVGLKLYELPNLNVVLLFYLVVRVDSSSIDRPRFERDWKKLKEDITTDMTEFLNKNKLEFKKFD